MDFKQIKPVIDIYKEKVAQKIQIDEMILYGSYAKGNASEDSDVDLIVISKDFAKMDDDDRLKMLYRLSAGFPYNLHVYGITPEEYQDASSLTTIGEAKRTGISIS